MGHIKYTTEIILRCAALKRAIDDDETYIVKSIADEIEQYARMQREENKSLTAELERKQKALDGCERVANSLDDQNDRLRDDIIKIQALRKKETAELERCREVVEDEWNELGATASALLEKLRKGHDP